MVVSGKLWRDALVMQDKETGSLWTQITGESFRGELQGTRLETYPFEMVSWKEWVGAHPDTKVLVKEEDARGEGSRYQKYFSDPDRTGIFGREVADTRLAHKDVVLAVDSPKGAKAYLLTKLPRSRVLEDAVGTMPVAVFSAGGGGFSVFRREVGDHLVDLALQEGRLIDTSGSGAGPWDPRTGRALEDGDDLVRLPSHETYWFGWVSFRPKSEVWAGE